MVVHKAFLIEMLDVWIFLVVSILLCACVLTSTEGHQVCVIFTGPFVAFSVLLN